MAEKVSTLIIEADLECEKCYKKIQKVLKKLKETEKISNINYDTEKNTVSISGPFDPEKLSQKLRCRACEAIKDIKVQEESTKPEKPDEESGDKKPPTEPGAATSTSSSTTVSVVQVAPMCNICYPWPCSDPAHWGVHPQHPQWPCEGMPPLPAFPGHHQHPPWAPATPKWTCGGPSYCRGCGSCRGGGMHEWPAMPPPPMCCPSGPSSCRGCKGCRIVQEGKFVYEEYPPSACAVM